MTGHHDGRILLDTHWRNVRALDGVLCKLDLYIASANPTVIESAIKLGAVGVATNPSVIAAEDRPWREVLRDAALAFDGPLLVQAVATDVDGILRDANEFRAITGERLIVKVAMSSVAIAAMRALQADGFEVMITTIVTPAQGIVAIQAGADQLGVYVGRAERSGIDPYAMIAGLRALIDRRGLSTKIGVGSINDIHSLVGSAFAGADNAAPVFSVLADAIAHPLTENAHGAFMADWSRVAG